MTILNDNVETLSMLFKDGEVDRTNCKSKLQMFWKYFEYFQILF